MKQAFWLACCLFVLTGFSISNPASVCAATRMDPSTTLHASLTDDDWQDEVKPLFLQFTAAIKSGVAELGKAESAKEAAAAFRKMTKEAGPPAAKLTEMEKVHPEIKDKEKMKGIVGADTYAELDKAMEALFDVGGKAEDKFKDDADFMAAYKEFTKILSN
ncbi:MAG: hypothetical protein K1Y36_16410 [Blastocatellia bacterium]|nr:hypothetical protein [Blastocatellia bacterium]